MANISLRKVSSALGVDRCSGLVKAAGQVWPPAAPIGLRQLIWSLAHPLRPTMLGLTWDLDVSGKPIIHPPAEQGLPSNQAVTMLWSDPGTGLRKADYWVVRILIAETGKDMAGSPFTPQAVNFSEQFQANTNYQWSVTPFNEFGGGPSSPTSGISTIPKTPPPTPHPLPQTAGKLTLQVRITLPAIEQNITAVQWQITGPGAPQGPQSAKVGPDGHEGEAVVTLPPITMGQPTPVYTILSTAAFHYNALTGPSGVTGAEDAQADLSQSAQIPWTGQGHTALFGIRYDGFHNVFVYTLDGLL